MRIKRALDEVDAETFWWPADRLRWRDPVVRVTQTPKADRPLEPSFDLSVFGDGLVVYEGRRCVAVGGLVVRRLRWAELSDVRQLVEANSRPWDIMRRIGADAWIGELEDRLGCEAGDRGLAPVDPEARQRGY